MSANAESRVLWDGVDQGTLIDVQLGLLVDPGSHQIVVVAPGGDTIFSKAVDVVPNDTLDPALLAFSACSRAGPALLRARSSLPHGHFHLRRTHDTGSLREMRSANFNPAGTGDKLSRFRALQA